MSALVWGGSSIICISKFLLLISSMLLGSVIATCSVVRRLRIMFFRWCPIVLRCIGLVVVSVATVCLPRFLPWGMLLVVMWWFRLATGLIPWILLLILVPWRKSRPNLRRSLAARVAVRVPTVLQWSRVLLLCRLPATYLLAPASILPAVCVCCTARLPCPLVTPVPSCLLAIRIRILS